MGKKKEPKVRKKGEAIVPDKVYKESEDSFREYVYKKVDVTPLCARQQIGRVILFIVGLGFVALSIDPIISSFKALINLGFKGDVASYYYLFQIISGFASIVLFAVSCFIASIRAKITFKYLLYFIVMLVLLIVGNVLFFVNKTPLTAANVLGLVFSYILPFGYVLGFCLLFIPRKS